MTMNQPTDEQASSAPSPAPSTSIGNYSCSRALLLALLGVAAIVVPPIATLAFELIIGGCFSSAAVVGLVTTFWDAQCARLLVVAAVGCRRYPRPASCWLGWPISGTLSYLRLDRVFLIEGIVTIMYAIDHRNQLSTLGWMLASGVVDLVLAGIIFAGLPGSAAWALGLLVGNQSGVRRHSDDWHGARGAPHA